MGFPQIVTEPIGMLSVSRGLEAGGTQEVQPIAESIFGKVRVVP